MHETTFSPGPTPSTVRSFDGKVLTAPARWVLLLPGDAALTRRVKAAGEHWVVQEMKRATVVPFLPASYKSGKQIHTRRLTQNHEIPSAGTN